ncbi:MAG: sulfotransferase [Henriciella sp.]|nr:sulfotransferase [Henriciella sp.]
MQSSNSPNTRLQEGMRKLARREHEALHLESIEMIKQNVRDPIPYFLLGNLAFEHQNHQKALSLFEQAVAYDLSSPLYRAYLAKALTTLNRQSEAREAAIQAAELKISDAHVADTVGVVLSRTGFHDLAAPLFERAVSLDPRPANFHYNLGSSLQFLGRFEDAKASYLNAIQRDESLHRAWSSLVSLTKQTDSNHHLDKLEALFATNSGSTDARLHYGHAIAKTLEDLGRFEESLDWLGRAKEKKRAEIQFDMEKELQHFQAAQGTLTPATKNSVQTAEEAPIFIVGLPRTGTTLVDRILSSHDDVVSAGELNTFAGLIKKATATTSNLVLDGETLLAADEVDLAAVGRAYLNDTAALAKGAKRFTDKMPLNFFYAGLIHRALPNARIVALRRDPMDSCLSNYRQLFATGFSYYNYTFDLSDTAQFYRAFDDLMTHWRSVIPNDRFLEIQYEDIVFHQERETRRLLEFCDLSWDEKCLRFHENDAPVSTASSVQVRQPLYSGSIGRWKRYGGALSSLAEELHPLV